MFYRICKSKSKSKKDFIQVYDSIHPMPRIINIVLDDESSAYHQTAFRNGFISVGLNSMPELNYRNYDITFIDVDSLDQKAII